VAAAARSRRWLHEREAAPCSGLHFTNEAVHLSGSCLRCCPFHILLMLSLSILFYNAHYS
jgi:hypothetical protein